MNQDKDYIDSILATGSEKAMLGLVSKYEKQVFNLCFRICRSREVAEEVAQDVFVKSFAELRKLSDRTKYGGWLMKIAYYASIDYARLKKLSYIDLEDSSMKSISDDQRDTPIEALLQQERSELIEATLAKLPPSEHAIVALYYMQGYSVKEVSEITELSESNVKVKLMRVRKLLKHELIKTFKEESKNLY